MGTSQFQLSVSSNQSINFQPRTKSQQKIAEKQSELRLKCSCPCSFATRWTHHVRLLEKVPTVPWILENGPSKRVCSISALGSDALTGFPEGCGWISSSNLKGLSHETFKIITHETTKTPPRWNEPCFGGLQDPQLVCLFGSKPAFIGTFSWFPHLLGSR